MMNRRVNLDKGAASSMVSASTIGAISWGDRLIARISCASESGIETARLRQLLLVGLAVLAAFGMAEHVFPILSGSARTLEPLPFQIVNLILVSIAALGVPWIGRNWRWWTLAFCITLTLSVTLAGIIVDEDDPVLMTLFVLVITSAVSIPWEAKWQGMLGLVALGSFSVSAMTGTVKQNDLQQWLSLTLLIGPG
jgi:hypothetical protein